MYAATGNGQRLTFGVEAVWRRNMILRDKETGTLWQQATGEALMGAFKGAQLVPLGGDLMTWAGWQQLHPQTTFALEPEIWEGLLPKARITAMLEAATKRFSIPGQMPTDHRLPFDTEVIGIVRKGEAKAYPLAHLRRVDEVVDQIGEQALTIRFDNRTNAVTVLSGTTSLPYQRTRWVGWYEFHPLTAIYSPRADENQGYF